ncbi:MAG TPA: DUF429 domain-containing protein [Acidimicrobiales bacterium]|nr:DUF429 domain-containing protein [Acidimicrobiales bacterium]
MAPGPPRGAPLPYSLLAGVEPCSGGWLVVPGKLHGVNLFPQHAEVLARFIDVLDYKPAFSVIALHVPVGLLSSPGRPRGCDVVARSLMGWPRGGAIVPAPTRAALAETNYERARTANGGTLSAATWLTMPHVREAAQELQPYWQRTVFEVHPELAFLRLNDDVALPDSKRTAQGLKQRRQLLEEKVEGIGPVLDDVPRGTRPRQLIDAAADLWTARRIAARAVVRLPDDPEWDDEGLRMEILY